MDTDRFISICKLLYLRQIHPFDLSDDSIPFHQQIKEIGGEIIEAKGLSQFILFSREYQYRINFWTATITLEIGRPTPKDMLVGGGSISIIDHCFEIIERYIESPLFEMTDEQRRNADGWMKRISIRYGKEI